MTKPLYAFPPRFHGEAIAMNAALSIKQQNHPMRLSGQSTRRLRPWSLGNLPTRMR